jgi:polar amino acid transport system permease protein
MDQATFMIQVLLPALADGLVLTLLLIAVSAPFGFLLGAGLAVGRTYGSRPLSFTARQPSADIPPSIYHVLRQN